MAEEYPETQTNFSTAIKYEKELAALEIELGTLLWNLEQCAALAIRTSKTDFSAEHDGRIRAPLLAVSSFVRDKCAELAEAKKALADARKEVARLQTELKNTDHSSTIAKLEAYNARLLEEEPKKFPR